MYMYYCTHREIISFHSFEVYEQALVEASRSSPGTEHAKVLRRHTFRLLYMHLIADAFATVWHICSNHPKEMKHRAKQSVQTELFTHTNRITLLIFRYLKK